MNKKKIILNTVRINPGWSATILKSESEYIFYKWMACSI